MNCDLDHAVLAKECHDKGILEATCPDCDAILTPAIGKEKIIFGVATIFEVDGVREVIVKTDEGIIYNFLLDEMQPNRTIGMRRRV